MGTPWYITNDDIFWDLGPTRVIDDMKATAARRFKLMADHPNADTQELDANDHGGGPETGQAESTVTDDPQRSAKFFSYRSFFQVINKKQSIAIARKKKQHL